MPNPPAMMTAWTGVAGCGRSSCSVTTSTTRPSPSTSGADRTAFSCMMRSSSAGSAVAGAVVGVGWGVVALIGSSVRDGRVEADAGQDAAAHVAVADRVDQPTLVVDDERETDPAAAVDALDHLPDRGAFAETEKVAGCGRFTAAPASSSNRCILRQARLAAGAASCPREDATRACRRGGATLPTAARSPGRAISIDFAQSRPGLPRARSRSASRSPAVGGESRVAEAEGSGEPGEVRVVDAGGRAGGDHPALEQVALRGPDGRVARVVEHEHGDREPVVADRHELLEVHLYAAVSRDADRRAGRCRRRRRWRAEGPSPSRPSSSSAACAVLP